MKRACDAALYLCGILLLSGDIEENPGPMTKAQEDKLNFVSDVVTRLESNHTALLESLNKILQNHITMKNDIELLSKRVLALESKTGSDASPHQTQNYDQNLSFMQSKIDDLENRSRRSNVLFFGIDDSDKAESWDVSEELVKNFCADKLEVAVTSIVRAHRLGKFSTDKKRPIIAKLLNEKDVETVLSRGIKLKDTTFGISRDYSVTVRDVRRKLLQFSKTVKKQGDRVRLVFTKLLINDDAYVWDAVKGQAVRLNYNKRREVNSEASPPMGE